MDSNSVPETMMGPKVIDDYLNEMLWEAKKSRELEQDQSLEKIQQKVLNIMEPLSKLWVGVDEVKSSGNLDKWVCKICQLQLTKQLF